MARKPRPCNHCGELTPLEEFDVHDDHFEFFNALFGLVVCEKILGEISDVLWTLVLGPDRFVEAVKALSAHPYPEGDEDDDKWDETFKARKKTALELWTKWGLPGKERCCLCGAESTSQWSLDGMGFQKLDVDHFWVLSTCNDCCGRVVHTVVKTVLGEEDYLEMVRVLELHNPIVLAAEMSGDNALDERVTQERNEAIDKVLEDRQRRLLESVP